MPLHIAIPAYAEYDDLPKTIGALSKQVDRGFRAWVCVNDAPDTRTTNPEAFHNNQATLDWLEDQKPHVPYELTVLDATGSGEGVGWAREKLAASIVDVDPDGITACLDADTLVQPNYVQAIRQGFEQYPAAPGICLPYYHSLPESEFQARLLLRYEVYMRDYQLRLWSIHSPYAYLALGSAMAFRHASWRAVRGIPNRKAGEDFYFLQKLRKLGDLIRWIPTTVFPSSRISKRVPFGTGTQLDDTEMTLQETRYPFFPEASFIKIALFYEQLENLFSGPIPLSIDPFLDQMGWGQEPFDKMRKNSKTVQSFIPKAHQFFDGLRTLQFLRFDRSKHSHVDRNWGVCFRTSPINEINRLRNHLMDEEAKRQKQYMEESFQRKPI